MCDTLPSTNSTEVVFGKVFMSWGWEYLWVCFFFFWFLLEHELSFSEVGGVVEIASSEVPKCSFLESCFRQYVICTLGEGKTQAEIHKLACILPGFMGVRSQEYFKLVCRTKMSRNPALWKLHFSSLCYLKMHLEILHGSCWMKFCPVFLPFRIRKKALERREETIIVDRACRQETLAYEMVSSLSSCRISREFSTAKIQVLVAFFFITMNLCAL